MKADRDSFYFVEISRGGAMTSKIFALFALLAAPISALAQMSCTALGAHLATQPNISQYVPPLPAPQVPQPFTQVIGTRCEANFIYSSRGGAAGRAPHRLLSPPPRPRPRFALPHHHAVPVGCPRAPRRASRRGAAGPAEHRPPATPLPFALRGLFPARGPASRRVDEIRLAARAYYL